MEPTRTTAASAPSPQRGAPESPVSPASPATPPPGRGAEPLQGANQPISESANQPEAGARARSARLRSDLAREDLETVKRTLRAVEAQANAADPATTPATAPSGDYIRTTFRRSSAKPTPAAWMVRAFAAQDADGNPTTVWRLWSPDWTLGRALRRPAGMGPGWNDLPASLASGTLHAALTWTGTATKDAEGAVSVTWTPGDPILTTNPAEIPADAEPVPADPETSSAGSTGYRSVIVAIGDFIPATTQGGSPTFEQRHVGAIVENMVAASGGGGGQGLPDGLTIPGWVSLEPIRREISGSSSSSSTEVLVGYALMQSRLKWDAAQAKFVDDGTFKQGEIALDTLYVTGAPTLQGSATSPTERACLRKIELRSSGMAVGYDTTIVAWERAARSHAQDHTDGVL